MIVEQIWTNNAYRNFNYLIANPENGEAIAVDPLDHQKCLSRARENGWEITTILNTHEHGDHTGGNSPMIAATGAKLIAHKNATNKIRGIDIGVGAGDVIRIGRVELEVLDTPGHTMSHICLLSHNDPPSLLCGDTLFNAGAGNCHNGGHPHELYETFANQLDSLPEETKIYPGHDYIANNLSFTLDREPDNIAAAKLLEEVKNQDTDDALITTIAMEREFNTFFRLSSATVIETLRKDFPDLADEPDRKTVFLKLRELRNNW